MINDLPAYADWTNGVVPPSRQDRAVRLICFPYAGGGASVFRFLKIDLASAGIDVYGIQLPGRESRWHERAFVNLFDLVSAVDEALDQILAEPFVLFGHSMGAFIAFELARRRRRRGRPGPALLVVSAARAPQIPDPDPPLHDESPHSLIAEMKRLDGIPHEVLAHPEFVEFLLPPLRADLTVCETYVYADEPPLSCPIVVYGGEHDEKVPVVHLAPWASQTTGGFQRRLFPGNHFFFLHESRAAVAQALIKDLQRVGAERPPALEAPRAQIEGAIAEIWRDLLRLPKVGVDDNFFALGGNSLLAIQAHARLSQTLSMNVSLLDLFRYPTIRLLAGAIQPTAAMRPQWGGN